MKAFSLTCVLVPILAMTGSAEPPPEVQRWLRSPQQWERDTSAPVVSLGEPKSFDDTHIFAPTVIFEKNQFHLWYCGSTGTVGTRVFQLGYASGREGRTFTKYRQNPVFAFGDGKHSILTPTFLRSPDGSVLRENGRLRMWFSSTWFDAPKETQGLHTLHESSSLDGISWAKPSSAQSKNVYAPTILKVGDEYRLWYVDVSADPWIIRHATSRDGNEWRVTPEPVLRVDQKWESGRLFYPHVIQVDGVYLMWYGSYWSERASTTAIGFAVSEDGITWHKHPNNPVLRPDPKRAWESNYVTSHSVLRTSDDSLRIWYASRKRPPFVNKYFAINTAIWKSPPLLATDPD